MRKKRWVPYALGIGLWLVPLGDLHADNYEVCAEWINKCDVCGNANLSCRDDTASGLYDTLKAHGYTGLFKYGNSLAWESDFKKANDANYIDACDIAIHADHGNHCVFGFGNTTHDNCYLWASETEWGNSDLEWIVQDDCSTIARNFNWTCWTGAFKGLHLIMGFDTGAHDSCTRGQKLADKLVAGWTVVQAWFYAAEQTEGAGTYAAVVGAGNSSSNVYNDHIWGHGSVSADPYPASYYWWTNHSCD